MPPNFTVALVVSTFCCYHAFTTYEFPRLRMPHKYVVVTLIQKGIKMKFTSL